MDTEHLHRSTGPVVGVTTTRIYCRPVCRPGRAPRRENCVPFTDAATARAAGFRACKQCRPDVAPLPRTVVRYGASDGPLGGLFVAATERGVCALDLLDGDDLAPALARVRRKFPDGDLVADPELAASLLQCVVGWVAGDVLEVGFSLDLRGTPFQLRVWSALRAIPRGRTSTYGALARSLGLPPGASRAVGAACGANPVSLVVPCHRVVGAGGSLGGYYWGLARKRALLDLEAGAAGGPAATRVLA